MSVGANKASWLTTNYAYGNAHGLMFMTIISPSSVPLAVVTLLTVLPLLLFCDSLIITEFMQ